MVSLYQEVCLKDENTKERSVRLAMEMQKANIMVAYNHERTAMILQNEGEYHQLF